MTSYSGTNTGTVGTDNPSGDGGTGGTALGVLTGSNQIAGTGAYTGGVGGKGSYSGFHLGGTGGYGVDMNGGSLGNSGTIAGGAGGNGNIGGIGGAGIHLSGVYLPGDYLTNHNAIVGGAGGYGYEGGNGGAGVEVANHGVLNNDAGDTITGGEGGTGFRFGGSGGVGVDLANGGVLANLGTISGGGAGFGGQFSGDTGDAVHFGAGDSTLVITSTSVFNGNVVATAANYNVIELGGSTTGTLDGIGTQFTGFEKLRLDSGAYWNLNGAVGAGVTVDLSGTYDTLGIGDATNFQATISGLDPVGAGTDVIDLKNVDVSTITGSSFIPPTGFLGSTGVLTLHTSGGDLTLNFANSISFTGEFFHIVGDGNTGTDLFLAATPCYCPGTRILTDRGEVAVESLSIGDRVITVSGAAEPIHWIGRRSYAGRFLAGKTHILPIRIKAGALGEQSPKRDLVISPLHAMYLDDVLVPAGELVNGVSIVQENVEQVDYIHIELKNHDLIWAEGSASETFIDDDSRMMFHNASEYPELYPEAERTPAQYCAPRLTEGYAVEAIRQRIAQRAGLTTKSTAAPAALRGNIDAIDRDGIRGWAQDPAYPEAAVCLDVLEDGKVIAQVLANAYRADLEQAGLGSGRHAFELRLPEAVHGIVEVRRSSDQQVLPGQVPREWRRVA